MISLECQMEAETLAEWPHFYSPLDCAAVAGQLTESLAEAKAAYVAARFVHDHAAAETALAELRDLTWLAGSLADGIADQRQRFMHSGRAWPLGRVLV